MTKSVRAMGRRGPGLSHDNQLTALPDDIGQLTALQVWLQETQPTSDPLSKKLQPHRPRMFWSCSSQGLGAAGFSAFTIEMPGVASALQSGLWASLHRIFGMCVGIASLASTFMIAPLNRR